MTKITVALPMYKAGDIGWIAIESLCRQIVTEKWELIICEEQFDNPFGKQIDLYKERLKQAGCERIEVIKLTEWLPLGQKWRTIALASDKDSRVFILQAADCYSPPFRLQNSFNLICKGADWVHSRKHIIYDIRSENQYLYEIKDGSCGADMCLRTALARKLPDEPRWKIVDSWIYNNCKLIKDPLKSVYDESNNWEYSLNVHGLNCISNRKFDMDIYKNIDRKLSDYIPNEITEKLRKLKAKLPGHTFVRKGISKYAEPH